MRAVRLGGKARNWLGLERGAKFEPLGGRDLARRLDHRQLNLLCRRVRDKVMDGSGMQSDP